MLQRSTQRVLATLVVAMMIAINPLSAGCCGGWGYGGGYYGGGYNAGYGYYSGNYNAGCGYYGGGYYGGYGSYGYSSWGSCCGGGSYGYASWGSNYGGGCCQTSSWGCSGCGTSAGCQDGCCSDCCNQCSCDTGCGSCADGGTSTSGCADCVSGSTSVVPAERLEPATRVMDSMPGDGRMMEDTMPDAGSGTRNEMPSNAPVAVPAGDPEMMPAEAGEMDMEMGGEELFEPAPGPADAGDDDLFDDSGDDTGADDMDDLFSEAMQMRTWQDDSGHFSTRGRLVELREGSVRLLKETGKHCTVPLHRLSDRDFQLVQVVALKRGVTLSVQLAQK